MEESKEINVSTFNEASFKMRRLDQLQCICNEGRSYPLLKCSHGVPGIVNHYNALLSLFQEISSKLNTKEIEKVKPRLKELKPLVRTLRRKLPANTLDKSKISWYESKEGIKEFDEVSDKLFEVEEIIRRFLDEKGFATMNEESLDGDSYK